MQFFDPQSDQAAHHAAGSARWLFVSRRRHGFTLVELLVVIAIIGILVGLLLPAVQAAREASRRADCKNRLKQLSLAVLLHVDTHGYYPTGGWTPWDMGDPDAGFGVEQPGGWYFNILPYLEEANVREQGRGRTAAEKRQIWTTACAMPIRIAFCPSRRSPERGGVGPYAGKDLWNNIDLPQALAHNDYAINSGDTLVLIFPGDYSKQTGISFYKSLVRPSQVTDGTTQTYMAGEKYLSPDAYDNGMSSGDDNCVFAGHDWDIARWTNKVYPPTPDTPGVDWPQRFGGPHPGVVNMALCDGSVHDISFQIDPKIHALLGNRQDGDIKNVVF